MVVLVVRRDDNGRSRSFSLQSVKKPVDAPVVASRSSDGSGLPIALHRMFLAGERNSMSTLERGLAVLLLGIAVAGGVLIPRLLSAPADARGVAISAVPGRIVVEAPAITRAPRPPSASHVVSPAPAVASPVVRIVPHAASAPHPNPSPVKRILTPAPEPAASPGPPDQAPPPPATDPSPPAATAEPAVLIAPQDRGRSNPPTGRGRDLRGLGHGSRVPQAPPHAVGPHHRGVGHLAPAPAGAAQAARQDGPNARPKARGRSGRSSEAAPPPPVASGHGGPPASAGHGHGK